MNDQAFALLARAINQCQQRALWVVDENTAAEDLALIVPNDCITVLTNRFDLAQVLQQRGLITQLSDFSADTFIPASFSAVFYRIGKEKSQVHHIINLAGQLLEPRGILWLAGYKQEGMQTYAKKATAYLGHKAEQQRLSAAALVSVVRAETTADPLDDRGYTVQQTLALGTVDVVSKPGIFGWRKVDAGSAFLIGQLPMLLEQYPGDRQRLLDLGCGYGYLSVMAHQLLAASIPGLTITATDNNIAATTLCSENFQRLGIAGEVVLDHCGASLGNEYDLILCNPPFHRGQDVERGLTTLFLHSMQRLLQPEGLALVVVNSFIPLEKLADTLFSRVDQLANNRQFKLIALTK